MADKRLIDANELVYQLLYMGANKTVPVLTMSQIVKAPSVDAVEVVHGRWECEHETWGQLQCSNCKKEALLEKSNGDVGTILLYVTSNYCPHCGAKMDGGAEDGKAD